MSIAFVQRTITPTTTTAATAPVIANTTVGNTVILAIRQGSSGTVTGVTDSQGNSYTVVNCGGPSTSTDAIAVGYQAKALTLTGNAGAPDTITVSGSASGLRWAADEYSGIAQTSPITAQVGTSSNGVSSISASITPVNVTDRLFAVVGQNSSATTLPSSDQSAAFTKRDSDIYVALYDDLGQGYTTAQTPTFAVTGGTANLSLVLVSLAAATGGGTTFTDAPSGVSPSSGTLVEISIHAASPSGASTSSGSRVEAQSHASAVTAVSVSSGTRLEANTHTSARTSTGTLSGTVVEHYSSGAQPPPKVTYPTTALLGSYQSTATLGAYTSSAAVAGDDTTVTVDDYTSGAQIGT